MTSEVEIEVGLPIAVFDRWFGEVALEDILEGHGAIPRIVRSEEVKGAWGVPGARRRVFMADGTSVLEEILANDRPGCFAYVVWGFPGLIGQAARYAKGEFHVSAVGPDRTHVRWRYSFKPKGAASGVLLKGVLATQFHPFMRKGLEAIRSRAEAAGR